MSAYRQAMIAAKLHKMKKIAFCILRRHLSRLIRYGFCEIAFKTIAAYLYDAWKRCTFTLTRRHEGSVGAVHQRVHQVRPRYFWQTALSRHPAGRWIESGA